MHRVGLCLLEVALVVEEFTGIHPGKEGKSTLHLEAIGDMDLWAWHVHFGLPGMLNDLNILHVGARTHSILANILVEI